MYSDEEDDGIYAYDAYEDQINIDQEDSYDEIDDIIDDACFIASECDEKEYTDIDDMKSDIKTLCMDVEMLVDMNDDLEEKLSRVSSRKKYTDELIETIKKKNTDYEVENKYLKNKLERAIKKIEDISK